MAKSIKLKNNNYIDSTGITHERELLSNILTMKKYSANNYLVNGWSTNGLNVLANINGLKIISLCVRFGTSTRIMENLPNDMRPAGAILVMANNYLNTSYAIISAEGNIDINSSLLVSTNTAIILTAIYY